MARYYAVKKGRLPGVYEDWEIAKQQVEGYSRAEYRSFSSREEAVAYLSGESQQCSKSLAKAIVACVDGSYRNGICGSGIVICDGNGMHEFYFWTDDQNLVKLRNVASEILSVLFAIDYALRNRVKHLVVKHDFENLNKWISGEYDAKHPMTVLYKNFINQAEANGLRIEFEKVKAHSKDVCNERADKLAKLAVRKNQNVVWNLGEMMNALRCDKNH
ncbi:ribonuclease H1 domain-containing protein [Pseudothermotoga sp.]|nr:ribonuclease H family protein [Pseudothermotoga sp.]MCX7812251.1 ribonuclease H family protein [Pseudothermotoga sp.]MDW8139321.1 ribonuclease H family protein [Pseudothermotoga sp.]